jgi:imidazoleglycerol-phosphate dehydratase
MDRIGEIKRTTSETDISIRINLDGSGKRNINTGVGFFDHMLDLFAKHGNFDLECIANGDIHIDYHHTVEDVGIAIGTAIKDALGNKAGIKRYGTYYIPMMETLTRTSVDLSGRGYLSFNCKFERDKVGEFDTELTEEFFFSVAQNGGINMHMDLIRGDNTHHIIESFFKSFARALKESVTIEGTEIPSTKGII